MKICEEVATQMKRYFPVPVVLFLMLYKVVLTSECRWMNSKVGSFNESY